MASQRHIIKKQVLEVQTGSREKAGQAQRRMKEIFQKNLLPAINEICDQLSPEGTLHRIERLEIDLGGIFMDAPNPGLSKRFKIILKKELSDKIRKNGSVSPSVAQKPVATQPASSEKRQSTGVPNQSINPDGGPGKKASERAEIQSERKGPSRDIPPARHIELLTHFLQTGLLPWWAPSNTARQIEEAINALLQFREEEIRSYLLAVLGKEQFRQRLIRHLKGEQLEEAIQTLSSGRTILSVFQQWQKMAPELARLAGASHSSFLAGSTAVLLYYLCTVPAPDQEAQALVESLVQNIVPTLEKRAAILEDMLQVIRNMPGKKEPLNQIISRLTPAETTSGWNTEGKSGSKDDVQGKNRKTEREENEDSPPAAADTPQSSPKPGPKTSRATERGIEQEETQKPQLRPDRKTFHSSEEIFLQNAGLVLLAPFLPSFFQHLEWLDEQGFKNPLLKQRAIQLLQYLADGSSEAPEFQLPLNKLLCGFPIESPVEWIDPVSEEEQEKGEEFLQAVISHAPILRNMSVNGFRNTFLRREGVLKDQNEYWLLRITRETYDLVLDRFPWSFNVVKLPWMERAIYVEW